MKKIGFTILAIAIGVLFVASMLHNSRPQTPASPTDSAATAVRDAADAAATPADVRSTEEPSPTSSESQSTPSTASIDSDADTATSSTTTAQSTAVGVLPASSMTGLSIQGAETAVQSRIGSIDAKTGFMLEAELSAWGASISRIDLSDHFKTVEHLEPYRVHDRVAVVDPGTGTTRFIYPFAARSISVNGQRLSLHTQRWNLIDGDNDSATLNDRATYSLTIVDENNQPVIEITRTFQISKDSYDLQCQQRVFNRTSQPVSIEWEQYGPAEMPYEPSYIDMRHFVAGYFDVKYDPKRIHMFTDNTFLTHRDVQNMIGKHADPVTGKTVETPFWPSDQLAAEHEMVWIATTNRYFATAMHLAVQTGNDPNSSVKFAPLQSLFPLVNVRHPEHADGRVDTKHLIFVARTGVIAVAPGAEANLDVSIFTGPRDPVLFNAEPYKSLGLDHLLVYSLGGMCAFCTFQWLAKFLLAFLTFLHMLVSDWGVAIVILVAIVRLILHPITKKSQVGMMKMQRQMAAIQPELDKIKKKYKDDQQKLQQEMMKLYREKGINPANMLGCLPMFLQMPIWIALYAMLYLAIELRHEPAFYGVFQFISGGLWPFLADLSSPDRFIVFSKTPIILHNIPVLNMIDFSSLNVLPILMAVVFYFQQKITTPPPTNDQMAQQQKIMKFMVLLFPLFLYAAPSGLTLYILVSTTAGIIDSYYVRKHVKMQEEAGTLFQKKESNPNGFFARLQRAAEAKQQALQEKQRKDERDKKRK